MAPPLAYRFRSLSAADLPLIQQWLGHPHVSEWWGDPTRGLANLSGDALLMVRDP
jgi:aminoglycoside 6'-N-acetyltransferase